ncbi:unnamed protein product [Trifolium pratense]|uniref:Uncharacterized protein n=1 Tax=Trifolium pratense TaxID=57577 RepID=A0ACB0KHD7_TRIPR|nr:unnamed protein product [Trifolium pratense]
MTGIIKFVYLIILFTSLFISVNAGVFAGWTNYCREQAECDNYFCGAPFVPKCLYNKCKCRLSWWDAPPAGPE